jgi:hypothetical protein
MLPSEPDDAGDEDDAAGLSRLGVYDGRYRVGTIVPLPDGSLFRALDIDDRVVGEFDHLKSALAAFSPHGVDRR